MNDRVSSAVLTRWVSGAARFTCSVSVGRAECGKSSGWRAGRPMSDGGLVMQVAWIDRLLIIVYCSSSKRSTRAFPYSGAVRGPCNPRQNTVLI